MDVYIPSLQSSATVKVDNILPITDNLPSNLSQLAHFQKEINTFTPHIMDDVNILTERYNSLEYATIINSHCMVVINNPLNKQDCNLKDITSVSSDTLFHQYIQTQLHELLNANSQLNNKVLFVQGCYQSCKTVTCDTIITTLLLLSNKDISLKHKQPVLKANDIAYKIISVNTLFKLLCSTWISHSTKAYIKHDLHFDSDSHTVVSYELDVFPLDNDIIVNKTECSPSSVNDSYSNYAIFYKLLSELDETKLQLLHLERDYKTYTYLTPSNSNPNTTTETKGEHISALLKSIGLTESERWLIMKLLACCLHFGNVLFVENKFDKTVMIENENRELSYIAELLDIKLETLRDTLLLTKKIVNNNSISVQLSIKDAVKLAHTFAILIYTKLTEWLVLKANNHFKSTAPHATTKTFTIIDTPGVYTATFPFSSRSDSPINASNPNSPFSSPLSMLCASYLEEKVKNLFAKTTYTDKLEMMLQDNLFSQKDKPNSLFNYKDNAKLLDIFENESNGVFSTLNYICENNLTDSEFVQEIVIKYGAMKELIQFPTLNAGGPNATGNHGHKHQSKRNSKISINKLIGVKNTFIINNHYEYNINKLIEDNYNDVPQGIYDCLLSSHNETVHLILLNSLTANELAIKKENVYDEFIMSNGNPRRSMYITSLFEDKINRLFTTIDAINKTTEKHCKADNTSLSNINNSNANITNTTVNNKYVFIFTFCPNAEHTANPLNLRLLYDQLLYYDINSAIDFDNTFYGKVIPFKDFNNQFEQVLTKHTVNDTSSINKSFLSMSVNDNQAKLDRRKSTFIIEKLCSKKVSEIKPDVLLGTNNIYIQKRYYSYLQTKHKDFFVSEQKHAETVSNYFLGFYYHTLFSAKTHSATTIQTYYRYIKHKQTKAHYNTCVVLIQSTYKAKRQLKAMRSLRNSAITIQKNVKTLLLRHRLRTIKRSVCVLVPHLRKFVYTNRIKERRGIRHIVMNVIVKRTIEKIKHKAQIKSSIVINSFMRMFLFRINHPTLIKKIKQLTLKRLLVKSTVTIQKFYRGYKQFMQFHILKFCVDYVKSYWKTKKAVHAFRDLRTKTMHIQKHIKKYFLIKHAYEHELNLYLQSRYDKAFANEVKDIKSFILQKQTHITASNSKNNVLLRKIWFYSFIFDVDLFNSTDIVYGSCSWINKYKNVYTYSNSANTPIIAAQISNMHTVLLTNKGKAFAFGWNYNGECVLNDNKHIINSITASENASFYLSNKCTLCSNSNSYLQLNGNDISLQASYNKSECILTSPNHSVYICNYNTRANSISLLKLHDALNTNISIEKVSCGKNFMLALSVHGRVYCKGKNSRGELGLGDFNARHNLTLIEIFEDIGEKILNISTGYKHAMCLSTNGKVFGWGSNSHGQLSLNKLSAFPTPMWLKLDDYLATKNNAIPTPIKAISIACGFRSSFILDDNQNIYYCGTSGVLHSASCTIKHICKADNSYLYPNDKNIKIVKVNCIWNNYLSCMYLTYVNLNNIITTPHKVKWCLSILASLWKHNNTRQPPYIKGISEYI